jgi:hypothetical protein
MKERLIEFLAYLEIGQNKFETTAGLSIGFVNTLKGNMTIKTLDRIKAAYPELNIDWLVYGEGNMLKPGTATSYGENSPAVGSVSGGVVAGTFNGNVNHNGSKDQLIETLTEKDGHRQETFIHELHGFREYIARQDDQIKQQSADLKNIVHHSYLRNKENMERIDKQIEQQNELIRILSEQSRRTQERADRLLDLLEKKL